MEILTSLSEESSFVTIGVCPRPRSKARIVGRILIGIVSGVFLLVISSLIVNAVREARQSQWRANCRQTLKQLGLAMSAYQDQNGHFPSPSITNSEGAPLLSWRVALLPTLGHQSLYDRFHLDEPWNSPHNLSLIPEMPAIYACSAGPSLEKGLTSYLVVVGPKSEPTSVNTPFDPSRGVDIREITDGTSNTVLVLESDRLVSWTKPEDLTWLQGGPLPRLVSPHAGGTHGAFADGSVRFLTTTTHQVVILALLTINGGEVLGGG